MNFEFVVYGASLEGLLVAADLHKKGRQVCVVEPTAKMGGTFAPVEFRETTVKNILSSTADGEETRALFGNAFPTDFAPTTFEKGHFEPFVGFGENAPKAVNCLKDFSFSNRIQPELGVDSFVQSFAALGIPTRLQTSITNVTFDGSRVTEVTLNEKETLKMQNLIYALAPDEITEIIDKNMFSAKALTKLSKGDYYSALQLSLVHGKPISDKKEIHFLYGTQKDPIVSVGHFVENTSQWISLIPTDSLNIHEEGTHILKEMKRQMKRAYPEIFDHVVFEKIALLPKVFGHTDFKSKEFGRLENMENLVLCSHHLLEGASPLANAYQAAHQTLATLGA
jgi:phytoene dehydrogenase-like protein